MVQIRVYRFYVSLTGSNCSMSSPVSIDGSIMCPMAVRLLCLTDRSDSVKRGVVSLRMVDEPPYQLPYMNLFCLQAFDAAQLCCFDPCGNMIGRLALDCQFLQHHQWVEKAGANPNVSVLQPAVPSV